MARPSTVGYLTSVFEQGLTDLQDYVLNPWQEQVATNDGLGTIGHPTQREVNDRLGNVYRHHDEHLPPLETYEPGMPEQEMEIGE